MYYIHRGAPGNIKAVEGSAIRTIDRAFLILEGEPHEVYIPYHRIVRIEFDNRVVFERQPRELSKKKEL